MDLSFSNANPLNVGSTLSFCHFQLLKYFCFSRVLGNFEILAAIGGLAQSAKREQLVCESPSRSLGLEREDGDEDLSPTYLEGCLCIDKGPWKNPEMIKVHTSNVDCYTIYNSDEECDDDEKECNEEHEEFDITVLRKLLKIERSGNVAYAGFEKERSASVAATSEAMAMILRLQNDKS